MTDHWVPNRNFLVWIFAYKLLHICSSWRYEGSRGRNTESCKLYFPLSAGEKMKRAQDTVNYDKLQEKWVSTDWISEISSLVVCISQKSVKNTWFCMNYYRGKYQVDLWDAKHKGFCSQVVLISNTNIWFLIRICGISQCIGGCLLHPTKRGCDPMGKVSCPTQRIAVVKSLKAMICKG